MPDITVDWLSWSIDTTFQGRRPNFFKILIKIVRQVGGEWEITEGKFVGGYKYKWYYNGIAMFSCDKKLDTVPQRFELSGTGCRLVDMYYNVQTEYSPLWHLLKLVSPFKITRLDLAADDEENILSLPKIEQKLVSGMWIGSARTYRIAGSKNMFGDYVNGVTYYIGSMDSDAMIRIYDKQAQMNTTKHWVRVELVLRRTHAQQVAQLLATETKEQINQLYNQIILGRLQFLHHKDHTKNGLHITCSWWTKFIGGCTTKHQLTRPPQETTVDSIAIWLNDKVAGSLHIAKETFGQQFIDDLLKKGEDKLSKRHRQILSEHRAEEKLYHEKI